MCLLENTMYFFHTLMRFPQIQVCKKKLALSLNTLDIKIIISDILGPDSEHYRYRFNNLKKKGNDSSIF